MNDLPIGAGKKRLQEVMTLAFEEASATQNDPPQFFWTAGETMAAFRADIQVYELKQTHQHAQRRRVANGRSVRGNRCYRAR